ncbi:MAG TPA: TSUP family transporter [Ktedonobacterales bacterium]|nr:TSUP family transporter [Ktedonobacterales bacterium]
MPVANTSAADRMARVRQAELVISGVLRGGVLLSAVITLIGVIEFYGRYGAAGAGSAAAAAGFPHTLGAVGQGLISGDPQAIIMLGLLLLLATPVARVIVSIGAFALEHDGLYVAITALVLLILLTSFFLSPLQDQASKIPAVPHISFFLVVFAACVLAGLIGSLVGLGGGIFVVPLLTSAFGLDIHQAIGASIVSVIATSSGAAAAYVREHITNLRVGMFLEIATTVGAISGAFLAVIAPISALYIIFGLVLIVSAIPLVIRIGEELPAGVTPDRWARWLALGSSYPDRRLRRTVRYEVTHVPAGFSLMYVAGLISGLLGIGSGTFKVLAMDTAMRLPLKVSTTTSNFMIGVTAAASATIYFLRGDIDPLVAAPVALGVLLGATIGARTLARL